MRYYLRPPTKRPGTFVRILPSKYPQSCPSYYLSHLLFSALLGTFTLSYRNKIQRQTTKVTKYALHRTVCYCTIIYNDLHNSRPCFVRLRLIAALLCPSVSRWKRSLTIMSFSNRKPATFTCVFNPRTVTLFFYLLR